MTSKIILIQQYFISSNPNRQLELDTCLQWNIQNPNIDEIHLLNETIYELDILKHPKIRQIHVPSRITYKIAFDYGNSLKDEDIKIFSNSDISLNEESLNYLKTFDLTNTCLALTRYDIVKCDPFQVKLFKQGEISRSQDTWIFKKIRNVNEMMNFELGKPGCDNHIAYLLRKNSKMVILNNSSKIITYHHHLTNVRKYNEKDRIGNRSTYLFLKYY